MADLKSKPLIVLKGVLFIGIALIAFALLLLEHPSVRTVVLAVLLAWGSCRFYYFLFYVLEKYVDATYCYAGICALISTILKTRRQRC